MARGNIDPTRRRRVWPRVLLIALIALGAGFAFRQGLVPPIINPLPILDLAVPRPSLLDWRLASIRHYPSVCARTLKAPHIEAEPIAENSIENGCGWTNGVRLVSAGGVRASFGQISCETAVALALWLEHEVQPLAIEIFGEKVASIRSYGSYACRNVIGSRFWRNRRSQHATANAVDIGGFVLADGRRISVRRHWKGDRAEGRFLRQAHARACPYFRAALGPDYNRAHYNHFHLDRGPFTRCE